MNKMFNGQNTLRDLALQLQQDITHMTRLMIPYIQLGFIELIEVDDIPSPLMNLIPTENDSRPEKGMIVCVDRSFSVAERIKAIVTTAGYKFLSFDNSNLAIASILAEKPDLIFLDLDSPNFSAYEICVRLRELSFLSDIPIVIMTENLGLMDRVRAKIVGCSDFLQKPIESKALLEMITKHIKKINS
jgi:chemotaxis family two-component system response regulator PixG